MSRAGPVRILGLDPGLRHTGWGLIEAEGTRIRHRGHGVLNIDASQGLSDRLAALHAGLSEVVGAWTPDEAAVEETFVNRNPVSTLKLGQARGIVLLVPAQAGLPVAEYPPNLVKKTVVGTGHAAKEQVLAMVKVLLPGCGVVAGDAADALAVAICHAQHRRHASLAASLR
ncbi:crossover junction endodeoxyribonuclease RuvC [Marinibaculum pumilum]|uniref:Crossover junction endodeoxyribonuclease RuvC n=1 Tax=Marinibaculum pumilum TaxID=1766165 RepID=A0ABV7L7F0_9PROT